MRALVPEERALILLDPDRDAELHAALAAFPYVLPTRGKREALSRAFWRLAVAACALPDPASRRQVRRACFARMHVLGAPGILDAEAYDRAAGFSFAFSIDWWTHALARRAYRAQPTP